MKKKTTFINNYSSCGNGKALFATRERIWVLDLIRGLCIFLMVFDHLMYDFGHYYSKWQGVLFDYGGGFSQIVDFSRVYWKSLLRKIVRGIVVFTFFFISGFCSTRSRSNLVRGFKLLLVAFIVTFVTIMLDGKFVGNEIKFNIDKTIFFGVLHCLAISMLFYAYLEKTHLDKPVILFSLFALIAVLAIYFNVANIHSDSIISSILGITNDKFAKSLDYFPIIPYLGVFLLGSTLGKEYYPASKMKKAPKAFAPLCFLGRNALVIYLSHQVVFVGIYYLSKFFI